MGEVVDLFVFVVWTVLAYMLFWYVIAVFAKDYSLIDIAWGLGFVVVAIVSHVFSGTNHPRQMLVTILVTIWGVRLAIHIAKRKLGAPEDWRYAAWRKAWGKHHATRALFQVFLLQGVLMYVIALPIIFVNADVGRLFPGSLGWASVLGLFFWLLGFCIEIVADAQLSWFKAHPRNKKRLMTDGLWKYSRHPNYFGEALQWWGLAIIVFPVELGWAAFLSPLVLTWILWRISIPMMESRKASRKGWKQYKERTSILVPWF